jgi:cation transport regulator ChaB
MPYSKLSDLPNNIKRFPLNQRKAWMASFNSAYNSFDPNKHKAANAEAYAFAVANSVVKKMRKSKKESLSIFPNGTKFTTEKELDNYTSIIETFLEIDGDNMKDYNIGNSILASLKEAKIDKDSRTAEIVALESGWSKNGNYYSKPVAESLAPFLLQRRKIYVNHVEESEKKLGRDLSDWAATVEEAYGKEGKCHAKIRFSENLNGEFLFKESLIHPEEVQFSIDALARAKEGEAEGKTGIIIEKFAMLDSLDFVDYASAGGKLIKAYASAAATELSLLHEAALTLKDRVEKDVEKYKLQTLFWAFVDFLHELSWSCDYDNDADKKAAIQTLVDEFLAEFGKIDVIKAFESLQKVGGKMNLVELKEKEGTLLEEFKKEILNSEEVKSKDTKITSLDSEVAKLTESLNISKTDWEKEKDSLVKEKENLQKEVDVYKSVEEASKRTAKVKELLKESTLGELEKLPKKIQDDLVKLEKDEDIKEAIKAYSELKSSITTVVTAAGVTTVTTAQTDDVSLAKDNDKAAKIFKSK